MQGGPCDYLLGMLLSCVKKNRESPLNQYENWCALDFIRYLRYLVSRYRIVTSMVFAILFFVVVKPNMISIVLGLPFLFLGEAIRLFSSGYIQKNSVLTQEGPYSLSRNPLYLGNFFLGFGFVVMAFQWYLIGLYLVLFYFIYEATIKEEEKKPFCSVWLDL